MHKFVIHIRAVKKQFPETSSFDHNVTLNVDSTFYSNFTEITAPRAKDIAWY